MKEFKGRIVASGTSQGIGVSRGSEHTGIFPKGIAVRR